MVTDSGAARRVWLGAVAGAATLALIGITQSYASRRIEGLPVDIGTFARREVATWLPWALLAPMVVSVGAVIGRSMRRGSSLVAGWTVAAAAILLAHTVAEVVIARALGVVPVAMGFWTNVFARFGATLAANLVVFCLIALAFSTLQHYREARERGQREADLRTELAESRLTILRMQLQPHFLFNTLHAISSLMSTNVVAARRMLVQLSDLLRAALSHGDQHEVPLRDELAFLDRYLEIQRIRFEDRLTVEINVDADVANAGVPSLLLQPLVENALRHGIERRAGPGFVRVRAWRRGQQLELEIADNGPGLDEQATGSSGGVGLANTRARLEQLYGSKQSLTLRPATEGGLAVSIVLPFAELPAKASVLGEGQ